MATLDGLPDADTAAVQGKYQKTAAGARSELEDPIFGPHELYLVITIFPL